MKLPEFYILAVVLLAGYTPPFHFNIIAIVLAALIIMQIVLKKHIIGVLLSSLFILVNLFMLGALISELSEFSQFNSDALQMLWGGLAIWCLNMFAAGLILYKYLNMQSISDTRGGV
ncbi:hypothetical protein KDU71_20110 [Carboxylicivirga sediminis]|uniref:Uncharacterized protein n=1 Tax=Carboxylicivirga sediminis TaxID=2006564 RepID=A0A941F7K4_9BACT|nr:hypothetical protein [Carboxylicivirga sediminis]MBR8537887.1 hypothetical protein [Carboxylicivirga sediminis]